MDDDNPYEAHPRLRRYAKRGAANIAASDEFVV
jgi:hypothetical protein